METKNTVLTQIKCAVPRERIDCNKIIPFLCCKRERTRNCAHKWEWDEYQAKERKSKRRNA